MASFSTRSKAKLDTCDKPLQDLFNRVILERDCTIVCGTRNERDQEAAFAAGHSEVSYPDSRHNTSPSKAVDVMPYPIDWDDLARISDFASFVQGVARGMGITVRWGGNFKSFYDGPHWEMPR